MPTYKMSVDSYSDSTLFDIYHIRKSVESILLLVPQRRGLHNARIVETSNAESPTLM